jgi:CspA family cold shock protein
MTKTGTVKFFNETKGWGFITADEQEYFVHASNLEIKIKENDEVTFEVESTQRGAKAVKVQLK